MKPKDFTGLCENLGDDHGSLKMQISSSIASESEALETSA